MVYEYTSTCLVVPPRSRSWWPAGTAWDRSGPLCAAAPPPDPISDRGDNCSHYPARSVHRSSCRSAPSSHSSIYLSRLQRQHCFDVKYTWKFISMLIPQISGKEKITSQRSNKFDHFNNIMYCMHSVKWFLSLVNQNAGLILTAFSNVWSAKLYPKYCWIIIVCGGPVFMDFCGHLHPRILISTNLSQRHELIWNV